MLYLGIDIGSSYLKLWRQDDEGRRILTRNLHHRGDPRRALLSELEEYEDGQARLLFSGALPGDDLKAWRYEGLLAEVDYLRTIHPQRRLLVIGAEKIECVHFDDGGRIVSYETNQACAAGTGSFLDEQLKRLRLSFADLDRIPVDEHAPVVASRCAVFAKTDLIHLQQAGHTPEALYNGLCQGLVVTGLKSVFGGRIPDGGDVILSGGLLANPHIRHFIAQRMPRAAMADNPALTRAAGLCHKARLHGEDAAGFRRTLSLSPAPVCGADAGGALRIERSVFPSQQLERSLDAFGNEVWHTLVPGEALEVYLGVDIGSTSTKAVLVDEKDTIRLDLYTRTAGDPIAATRRLFHGIAALTESLGARLTVKACSTTGSGRTLVGAVIGADLVMNEISAHAAGALAIDPHVETIFEIGGQDAKFIRLAEGRVVDVNMNYVCAAGTGSFIEEQAGTMGMALTEIGPRVMGEVPLANSDRCTVFMNQEVTRQIAAGHSKERIMAGVLLAVFKNYIHRVVGPRPYSRDRIVFQGATARNQGLVAALEHLTGAVVSVSPFCHVMGAFGAALLAKARVKGASAFKGFHLPEIRVSETRCRQCENSCRLTVAERDGEKITWGYLCGREGGSAAAASRMRPWRWY
ncbi:MAG TPA: acyl-CoA dehydratase activase, partial [Deltaproteobacteria bacterium]|nr:acyl-CoA dehydratase activase [Deltaproteobacteria bacterium]